MSIELSSPSKELPENLSTAVRGELTEFTLDLRRRDTGGTETGAVDADLDESRNGSSESSREILLAQNTNNRWRAPYGQIAPGFKQNPNLVPRSGHPFAPELDKLPPPGYRPPEEPWWSPNRNNMRRWSDPLDACRVPRQYWQDPRLYDYLCRPRR